MTKSQHRQYRRFRERMTVEMGLQMFPENRYWRRRRDVQRPSVPQSGSSDRKSLIADGWKTGAWDNKRWCWCRGWASSADDWWSSSARYVRAVQCTHLYTKTASLNLMRSGTFSQCNCVRSGMMRSYLDAENTSRAAEFNTDCIRLLRWDGMPASVALP